MSELLRRLPTLSIEQINHLLNWFGDGKIMADATAALRAELKRREALH